MTPPPCLISRVTNSFTCQFFVFVGNFGWSHDHRNTSENAVGDAEQQRKDHRPTFAGNQRRMTRRRAHHHHRHQHHATKRKKDELRSSKFVRHRSNDLKNRTRKKKQRSAVRNRIYWQAFSVTWPHPRSTFHPQFRTLSHVLVVRARDVTTRVDVTQSHRQRPVLFPGEEY